MFTTKFYPVKRHIVHAAKLNASTRLFMSSDGVSSGARLTDIEGSVLAAGGAFGKRGRSLEEAYFYNLQKQRIKDLRVMLEKEEKLFKEIYCPIYSDEATKIRSKDDEPIQPSGQATS